MYDWCRKITLHGHNSLADPNLEKSIQLSICAPKRNALTFQHASESKLVPLTPPRKQIYLPLILSL